MRRIESLDYLRGLMALSVMLYHFAGMTHEWPPAEDLLGRLGIYAVSIFYILSGLSLTVVYRDRMASGPLVAAYAVKRAFRIIPLFWLVVTLSLMLGFVTASVTNTKYSPDWYRVFLNYSLLFGFVKPNAYLSIGAWSIGNETVFYVLFPFLVYLGMKRRWVLVIAGAGFFLLYAVFAFLILDAGKSVGPQFTTYINPFNQAFLFVAGVTIGFFVKPGGANLRSCGLLLLFALAFWLYPASGDQISIVTGPARIIMSFICIGLVAAVYIADLKLSGAAGKALQKLGEISYGVYLLHPLIGTSVLLLAGMNGMSRGVALMIVLLLVGIPLTLLGSYASYRFLEQPLMWMGDRQAAKISPRRQDSSQAVAG